MRLENGDPVDRVMIAALAGRSHEIVEARECRSDVVRAAFTVVLHNLERQDPAAGFDAWVAAITTARAMARHAASCNPSDGNVWARLALIERAIGENPATLSPILAMSGRLSRAEYPVIRARFVAWERITDATLVRVRPLFEQDLGAVLRSGRSKDVATTLGHAGPRTRAEALFQAAALDGPRRERLVKAGLPWLAAPPAP